MSDVAIIGLFLANEVMAFLTLTVVFPGMLPPNDKVEWIAIVPLFLIVSLIWPVYLAVAPITFFIMWSIGDWKPSDTLDKWPWKHLRRPRP